MEIEDVETAQHRSFICFQRDDLERFTSISVNKENILISDDQLEYSVVCFKADWIGICNSTMQILVFAFCDENPNG